MEERKTRCAYRVYAAVPAIRSQSGSGADIFTCNLRTRFVLDTIGDSRGGVIDEMNEEKCPGRAAPQLEERLPA